MRFTDLIATTDQVVINLQARDRWQAIEELIAILASAGRIASEHADAIAGAVREREQAMSTGIGHGIALPHAASPLVEQTQAALGIARHDIDFDALDRAPVHLVLLLVAPQNQFQSHLDTLSDIARILNDATTRKRLCAAGSAAEVLEILRDNERA
ncbi:MAG: PTS sugar transporter subunit IIA [Gammaproteobacteria bacterium]|nr:PTS sugar transporter subunit IIA [Gammaproteobacteria bacterium]